MNQLAGEGRAGAGGRRPPAAVPREPRGRRGSPGDLGQRGGEPGSSGRGRGGGGQAGDVAVPAPRAAGGHPAASLRGTAVCAPTAPAAPGCAAGRRHLGAVTN